MRRRTLAEGSVVHLVRTESDPYEAAFVEMLTGWCNQMRARNLKLATIDARRRTVRRFAEHHNEYPWSWTPAMLDEWIADCRMSGIGTATVRAYALSIRQFCEYLVDPAYGWQAECQERFEAIPVQILGKWNTARHVQETGSDKAVRPFRPEELQDFLD